MKFPGAISKVFLNGLLKIKNACPPLPISASMLVVLIVFSWFVTEGSWQFTAPLTLGYRQFFDYQADSILHGRLDVPPQAIGAEAFVYNGKSFGYFGIGPSLLRIPLNFLFPAFWGKWSELFLLAGCIINLLCAYWIYRELCENAPPNPSQAGGPARPGKKRLDLWFSFLILVLGIGSTNIFLSSHASLFHEPIMLGAAFCLLSCLFYIKWIKSPSPLKFSGLVFFAFLAFFTRITTGMSAMLLIAILLLVLSMQKWAPSLAQKYLKPLSYPAGGRENKIIPLDKALLAPYIVAGFIFFLLVLGLYFWINQTKFGVWFDDHSYRYYALVKPDSDRYKRTDGGKSFFIQNYPMMASVYFFPLDIQTTKSFPLLVTNQINPTLFSFTRWDSFELTDPATLCMPLECILALLGLYSLARVKQRRFMLVPLLTTAASILIMLGFNSASQRYEHDFFPFFLLADIGGFIYLTEGIIAKKMPVKRMVLAGFLILGVLSIYQSLAITFYDQRNGHFLISAERITELKKLSSEIDQEAIVTWRNVKKIIDPLRGR